MKKRLKERDRAGGGVIREAERREEKRKEEKGTFNSSSFQGLPPCKLHLARLPDGLGRELFYIPFANQMDPNPSPKVTIP